MTTVIQGAWSRLEAYVAECLLKREDLDVLRLKRLEADVVAAVRCETGLPF